MKDLRNCGAIRCKECGKPLPKAVNKPVLKGKALISWAARGLGYCRYCYLMYYPERKRLELPALRMGFESLLSYADRRLLEKGALTYGQGLPIVPRSEVERGKLAGQDIAFGVSLQEEQEESELKQEFYEDWVDYIESWQEGGCEDV
ncbi:MAG: hypothetical protein HY811_09025 [Planctomycetes bacterium]|nr:hypothetical protein [Planctomycetota bacterium]